MAPSADVGHREAGKVYYTTKMSMQKETSPIRSPLQIETWPVDSVPLRIRLIVH